jgi:tetratricopeptide (TPR) repeat protein
MRALLLLLVFGALAGCRESTEEHIRKAHVLFKNGELAGAEAQYSRALELDAKNAVALEGLGNVLFERGDAKGAHAFYERAVAADPKSINAKHRLAIAKSELGDHRAAIAILEETLALDRQNVFALHALGGLYQKTGDLARAEEKQLEALRADANHLGARYALATLFIDSGRLEEAERELTKLHTRGAEAVAEYGFARVAAKRGSFEDAAKRLARVLELGVTHPEKILADEVFRDAWSHPAMAAIRAKLGTSTSTTTVK